MSSQPTETAQEDIRNALQVLNSSAELHRIKVVQTCGDDLQAIRVRLEAALSKLEAASAPEQRLAELYRGRITLRADGDHIVRSAPLDYVVPGQVDPVLRGQEITEDGE